MQHKKFLGRLVLQISSDKGNFSPGLFLFMESSCRVFTSEDKHAR